MVVSAESSEDRSRCAVDSRAVWREVMPEPVREEMYMGVMSVMSGVMGLGVVGMAGMVPVGRGQEAVGWGAVVVG